MANEIRVRFAPSPTGFVHVGSLRTALYNYLYAKKVGGKFILRIEDTDQNRFVEGAIENLINTIKMAGFDYDEGPEIGGNYGPYYQSERTQLYQKYAEELIANDKAYYCFCTQEELSKMKEENKESDFYGYNGKCRNLTSEEVQKKLDNNVPHVIRLKLPLDGEITFYDVVREKVTFPWNMIDDQVLIKSDGFPTYHLANVVDDHLMEISHVIRGEEWLSSTPKHLFLYEAFGWKPPKMVHLPLLLNPDRTKLSKRQGDVAVEDFIKKGYLPETLVNFVALLGWHAKNDREIYTLKELEKAFSIKRITKAGAVFDITKLDWMNGQYIRSLDLKYIAETSKKYFLEMNINISDEKKYRNVIKFARERVSRLNQIVEESIMFYQELIFPDEDLPIIKSESAKRVFSFWAKELSMQEKWNDKEINNLVNRTQQEIGVKGKDLYLPLRLALYGKSHGPDMPTLIGILGKEESIKRFKKLI